MTTSHITSPPSQPSVSEIKNDASDLTSRLQSFLNRASLQNSRVVIKNLPTYIPSDRLQTLCSTFGTVTQCQIQRTKQKSSRRIGFIGFSSKAAAEKAIKSLNGSYLDTAKLIVSFAVPILPNDLFKEMKQLSIQDPKRAREIWKQATGEDGAWSRYSSIGSSKKSEYEKKKLENPSKTKPKSTPQVTVSEPIATPKKKGKSWENDLDIPDLQKDSKLRRLNSSADVAQGASNNEEMDSDEEYQDMKKDEEEEEEEEEEEKESATLANSNISDLDYFRSKIVKPDEEMEQDEEKKEDDLELNSSDLIKEEPKATKKQSNNTGRIFIHNLSFLCSEEELREFFSSVGRIEQVHVSLDPLTHKCRGFAFIQFSSPEEAQVAVDQFNVATFQGRTISVKFAEALPSKKGATPTKATTSQSPSAFKKEKLEQLKESAQDSTNWNPTFMRSDAVAQRAAQLLGISSSDILNPFEANSSGAVNLAVAETELIKETKKVLLEEGLDLRALRDSKPTDKRSTTIILVKNLPANTSVKEIQTLFSSAGGTISRVIIPPSNTIALVEFNEAAQARSAFRRLAYSDFKHVPLFLEWAPADVVPKKKDILKEVADQEKEQKKMVHNISVEDTTKEKKQRRREEWEEEKKRKEEDTEHEEKNLEEENKEKIVENEQSQEEGKTLFVKNLNFNTTVDTLTRFFSKFGTVETVNLPKIQVGPSKERPAGYGFVQFSTPEEARRALSEANQNVVDDFQILLSFSSRTTNANKNSSSSSLTNTNKNRNETHMKLQDGSSSTFTKLSVKNLAFEVTEKELLDLFRNYGVVKQVRLPRKTSAGNKAGAIVTHKGYGFVEFASPQEAYSAKQSLTDTHLYGRRMVVDFAVDKNSVEAQQEKMKRLMETGTTAEVRDKKKRRRN